ncbi:MAG: small multi-drug export protein [Oscillospiraceae bacterium]|nr:small multi-drug export protein [Oscillospiraceae bacterium]
MELLDWLNNSIGGEFIFTMLVSMLPVVELRGGIPFGAAMGLNVTLAAIASVIGNMLPIPVLIMFTTRVFQWLKRKIPWLNRIIEALERRAESKRSLVEKYRFWGLLILVAIPLPGTGAWTGALVAAVMGMNLKQSMPAIFGGVVVAAIIVSLVTLGVIHI